MKKVRIAKSPADESDEMLPDYTFDYRKARPNRFAQKIEDGSLIVVLEPDIARVFGTPEAVKKVLRALIETMPQTSGS
jgi:hypothetical protein